MSANMSITGLPLPQPPNNSNKRTPETSPREESSKQTRTPEKQSPSSKLSSSVDALRLSPRNPDNKVRKRLFASADAESHNHAPHLKQMVDSVKVALHKSQDSETELMPVRADPDSASGCYFCKDADQRQKTVVVKPALQETGGPHSPTETAHIKTGINPGESCVREFFAWVVQERLKLPLGVPPVCLTTLSHPLFGNLKMVDKYLQNVNNCGLRLDFTQLFELLSAHKTFQSFSEAAFRLGAPLPMKDLEERKVPQEIIGRLIQFCVRLKDEKSMSTFNTQLALEFPGAEWVAGAKPKIIKLWGDVIKQQRALEPLRTLFTAIKEKQAVEEYVSSVQQFEASDCSLETIKLEELALIPEEEWYKLVIHFILYNTDLHLNNILVKKGTDQSHLIMIDHGKALPRPLIRHQFAGLKDVAQKGILGFKEQLDVTIKGPILEVLSTLNVADFIQALKTDLAGIKQYYPKEADAIDEECFLLLEFNLKMIQIGIREGAKLRQFATFQFGPPLDLKRGAAIVAQPAPIAFVFERVLISDSLGKLSIDQAKLEQEFRAYLKNK